jgi:hypothetical protein
MKIVELSTIIEPVPPKKYGGTELVIHNVTEELVRQGHEVYLLATGDSTTGAHLIPLLEKSFRELFPSEKYSPKEIDDLKLYWKLKKSIEAANTDSGFKTRYSSQPQFMARRAFFSAL